MILMNNQMRNAYMNKKNHLKKQFQGIQILFIEKLKTKNKISKFFAKFQIRRQKQMLKMQILRNKIPVMSTKILRLESKVSEILTKILKMNMKVRIVYVKTMITKMKICYMNRTAQILKKMNIHRRKTAQHTQNVKNSKIM